GADYIVPPFTGSRQISLPDRRRLGFNGTRAPLPAKGTEMTSDKPGFTLMRSVLPVPIIVQRFIDKAPSSGADVICLDLEDSVPPDEKAAARPLAAKAIETMPRGTFALYARLNGL